MNVRVWSEDESPSEFSNFNKAALGKHCQTFSEEQENAQNLQTLELLILRTVVIYNWNQNQNLAAGAGRTCYVAKTQ